MGEFRFVVQPIHILTVLGDTSERQDVIQIHAEVGINIIHEILFRGLVERNDGESRAIANLRQGFAAIRCGGGGVGRS